MKKGYNGSVGPKGTQGVRGYNIKITQKMLLESFYILKSELKFKGYELTLINGINENYTWVSLKELKTEKFWKFHLLHHLYCIDVNELINGLCAHNEGAFTTSN